MNVSLRGSAAGLKSSVRPSRYTSLAAADRVLENARIFPSGEMAGLLSPKLLEGENVSLVASPPSNGNSQMDEAPPADSRIETARCFPSGVQARYGTGS